MRYLVLPILLSFPLTACVGNIKDTDLITSDTFFLPPSPANTVFIQARNSSDNQGVSLTDLGSRLTAKTIRVSKTQARRTTSCLPTLCIAMSRNRNAG